VKELTVNESIATTAKVESESEDCISAVDDEDSNEEDLTLDSFGKHTPFNPPLASGTPLLCSFNL
jgi:hypothetical protein